MERVAPRLRGPCGRNTDFSPQAGLVSEPALESSRRVCAVLTFLRDQSRAPFRREAPNCDSARGCARDEAGRAELEFRAPVPRSLSALTLRRIVLSGHATAKFD